jgi:dUTP pyrophosphatase
MRPLSVDRSRRVSVPNLGKHLLFNRARGRVARFSGAAPDPGRPGQASANQARANPDRVCKVSRAREGAASLTTDPILVRLSRLPHGEGLELPTTASSGSAGIDLRAAIDDEIDLGPGERVVVPTGIAVAIPEGYEGQVRPRSGLALEHGLTLLNTPGTIDSDYRGEVKVILINLGQESFRLSRGDRVAQMVVSEVSKVRFVEASELSPTERGGGGFGSSGIN